MKSIQVKDLKAGMVLSSGAKVVADPVSLCNTPKGKVEIGIEYTNGKIRAQEWNKYTMVKILQNPMS